MALCLLLSIPKVMYILLSIAIYFNMLISDLKQLVLTDITIRTKCVTSLYSKVSGEEGVGERQNTLCVTPVSVWGVLLLVHKREKGLLTVMCPIVKQLLNPLILTPVTHCDLTLPLPSP